MDTLRYSISKANATTSIKQRVRSIYHMAYLCKSSQDEVRKQVEEQINIPLQEKYKSHCGRTPKAKHTMYIRGYANGLLEAAYEKVMEEQVEFCYLVDGVLYTTSKTSDKPSYRSIKDDLHEKLMKAPNGFYWKGTDKPYFIAKAEGTLK